MKKYGKVKKGEPRIGIELEIGNIHVDSEASVAFEDEMSEIMDLTTTSDGGGTEFQFPPLSIDFLFKNKKVFQKAFDKLNKNRIYSDSSKHAGMHVHLDKKSFSYNQFVTMVQFLALQDSFVRKMSKRTARHNYNFQSCLKLARSRFIVSNPKTTSLQVDAYSVGKKQVLELAKYTTIKDALSAKAKTYCSLGEGFAEINRKGYPTVEFRMFNSTSKLDVFYANFLFIYSLWDFSKSVGKITDIKDPKISLTSYLKFVTSKPIYQLLIKEFKRLNIYKLKTTKKPTRKIRVVDPVLD